MRFLKTLVPSLAFAFGVVATSCESKSDTARKPALVDSLVTQSIQLCDTAQVVSNAAPYAYAARLRKLLLECKTQDLATLKDHNIAIAFDRRLSDQKLGLFDKEMYAVFYNNKGHGGTLALWDDGQAETGIFRNKHYRYVSETVEKLADQVREGVPADMTAGIAERVLSGRRAYNNYKIVWRRDNDFDKDTRQKNETILRNTPRRHQNDPTQGSW